MSLMTLDHLGKEKEHDLHLYEDGQTQSDQILSMDSSFEFLNPKAEEHRLQIVIPGTLIEKIKVNSTYEVSKVTINLRYGNVIVLQIEKKSGVENFERFKKVVEKFALRVSNISLDVNHIWSKDFYQIHKNEKSSNLESYVEAGKYIGSYQKGMIFILESLGLFKDFKVVENIDIEKPEKKGFHKANICETYPTQLFVPR